MSVNEDLGKENVGKLLLRFSIPGVISLIISSLYNIVDQIFVGNSSLGYIGNAATGVVFPVIVVTQAFAWGFGDGCASYLSICQGKKETEKANKAIGTGLTLTLIASVLIILFSLLFAEPILTFCGASEKSLPYAKSYLFITAFFFPTLMISNMANGIIRSDGSPLYAMITTGVGAIINIILDPIFIYVCNWGIEGAAWATVIGQITSFILTVAYFFKSKTFRLSFKDFIPDIKNFKEPSLLGISSFITQMTIVVINLVGNTVIVKYGNSSIYGQDIPISIISIETKVSTLVLNIVVGIALGGQPIVGYNMGAKKIDRVKKTYILMLISTLIIGLIFTAIIEIYPEGVIYIFGGQDEPLYIEYGKLVFRLFLATVTLTCFIKMSSIFFQSCGQPLKAMISSLLRDLLFFVPAVIIIPLIAESNQVGSGVVALLYAPMIADILATFICVFITLKLFKELNNYAKLSPSEEIS